jgi:ElaB/YqjD/DUF883 family membrane-anchored ribosome-binding protein
MKRPDETDPGALVPLLEAEVAARRNRIAGNLDELAGRLTFSNLVAEGKEAAWKEVDRVTDEILSIGEDLVNDSLDWVKQNRLLAVGGTLTAVLAAVAIWAATRRTTVPIYAAYDMEDPDMTNDSEEGLKAKAADAWGKVRSEARHAGDRAGEAYYAARSKAAELSDVARERAADAAEVARERAAEAAEAAREAAEKAREAAGEARRWAVKQPQENPAGVVFAALAVGAVIGLLLPASGRDRA